MQERGLEWVYRLSKEPRRLWKRYTVYNVIFIGAFVLQRLRLARLEGVRVRRPDDRDPTCAEPDAAAS